MSIFSQAYEDENDDLKDEVKKLKTLVKEALYAGVDIGATYQEMAAKEEAMKWLKQKGIEL